MTGKKTLILGLGNDILTDDGIGPRIVRDLSRITDNPDVHFDIACCGGLEIMEYIKDFDRVIFIDAIRTKGGKPGDVHYFVPSDFRETSHLSSIHDVYFLTALKLGDTLDMNLPADLHIIGVEIVEDMEFSEDFTIPLTEKYPLVLQEVKNFVQQLFLS